MKPKSAAGITWAFHQEDTKDFSLWWLQWDFITIYFRYCNVENSQSSPDVGLELKRYENEEMEQWDCGFGLCIVRP